MWSVNCRAVLTPTSSLRVSIQDIHPGSHTDVAKVGDLKIISKLGDSDNKYSLISQSFPAEIVK